MPDWIEIKEVSNYEKLEIVEYHLDKGEASAIVFAMENPHSLLILDDIKARKFAKNFNLNFTGTLGIIIKAKNNGIISSIKPILKKIKDTDFRLTHQLEEIALKLSLED